MNNNMMQLMLQDENRQLKEKLAVMEGQNMELRKQLLNTSRSTSASASISTSSVSSSASNSNPTANSVSFQEPIFQKMSMFNDQSTLLSLPTQQPMAELLKTDALLSMNANTEFMALDNIVQDNHDQKNLLNGSAMSPFDYLRDPSFSSGEEEGEEDDSNNDDEGSDNDMEDKVKNTQREKERNLETTKTELVAMLPKSMHTKLTNCNSRTADIDMNELCALFQSHISCNNFQEKRCQLVEAVKKDEMEEFMNIFTELRGKLAERHNQIKYWIKHRQEKECMDGLLKVKDTVGLSDDGFQRILDNPEILDNVGWAKDRSFFEESALKTTRERVCAHMKNASTVTYE
jgi:hypothetical protein